MNNPNNEVVNFYQMTNNENTRKIFQFRHEYDKEKVIPFIIRGNLAWDSKNQKKYLIDTLTFWLRSNLFDLNGKSMKEHQIEFYSQLTLNSYEIWGGISFSCDINDLSDAKQTIEECLSNISRLTDIISFLTSTSIRWYPARLVKFSNTSKHSNYIQFDSSNKYILVPLKDIEERSFIKINDDHFDKQIFPLLFYLNKYPNKDLSVLLVRAISWHSQGNQFNSGLNSFLNYWESIELISNYLYSNFKSDFIGKPNKITKKKKIMKILEDEITESNCLKVADQCCSVLHPSIKDMMCAALGPFIKDDIKELFFSNYGSTGKSFYDIRNDIAHGNHCDHNLEFLDIVNQCLPEMRNRSRQVIISIVQELDTVMNSLN